MTDKINIKGAVMSKEDQAKILTPYLKAKKYQINLEINGKKKFAYCDDPGEVDLIAKALKAKILKVIKLHD